MSATYRVRRTESIGTVGVEASSSTGARRTVSNIGTTTLEIVEAVGAAYGTGHPLPPGASFNFDDAGSMSGPLFLASSAAGGAASILEY